MLENDSDAEGHDSAALALASYIIVLAYIGGIANACGQKFI